MGFWRRIPLVVLLALLCSFMLSGCITTSESHWIAEGNTNGRIVLAADDSLSMHAAEELQFYLEATTGAYLPITMSDGTGSGAAILVGWGEEATAVAPDLSPDSYLWHSTDNNQLIIGGPGNGTLFGVYAFLEEQLGVRMYTPEVTHIPQLQSFDLPHLDEIREPAFPIRWVHMPCAEDQAWCDWHGVHSRAHRNESWGMFVHTFETLVPPEEHFEEHPEYFSEIKGNRLPNQQLCLTNEDVFTLVVEGLRERMADRPDAPFWSVSANDRYGACQCTDCQALVDKHDSQAGPLLVFVNRVAAEFPDKVISTLAYSYTRRAPRDIKPAPNVNICLCSIECDRAVSIASGERDPDFLRDIKLWSELTDNLMMWDYVVQFSNYVSPFPNFKVLQPNIQLFRDHNVQLMFQQGSGGSKSDFSELKQYVIAKLLWDPDRDVEELINDFMAGYYGDAAGQIHNYIDLMQSSLQTSNARLGIYGNPGVQMDSWLKPETLIAADEILAAAEQAVEGQPEVLARVRKVRLSVTFARIEQAKRVGTGEYGMFEASPDGDWQVKDQWPKMLNDFVADCNTADYETIHERNFPPEEYLLNTRRFFDEGMVNHLALGRAVDLTVPPSPKYSANGITTLVDGIKGINDYWYSWQGWEATDMDLTIDLGEIQDVSRVAADFLQVVASWIWLPTEVQWSTSQDGENWTVAGVLKPEAATTAPDRFVERFECSFPSRTVRFVRLEATSLKECPHWHSGAGGDAWMFCDEVMVFE